MWGEFTLMKKESWWGGDRPARDVTRSIPPSVPPLSEVRIDVLAGSPSNIWADVDTYLYTGFGMEGRFNAGIWLCLCDYNIMVGME